MVRTPAERRDTALVDAALHALTGRLAIAEARLARHPFLCGTALTLADIQFGHILYRYFDIPLKRTEMPALHAYFQRLGDRPAYRRHVMVSYEALRA